MRALKILITLLFFSAILLLDSCDGLFQEEITADGKLTFWSNFDGPPIDIYIDNVMYGTITQYYKTSPGCEADGSVTVTLIPGTYNFFAVEKPNDGSTPRSWDGTKTVEAYQCTLIGLSP